jgi:hypothetical protein
MIRAEYRTATHRFATLSVGGLNPRAEQTALPTDHNSEALVLDYVDFLH